MKTNLTIVLLTHFFSIPAFANSVSFGPNTITEENGMFHVFLDAHSVRMGELDSRHRPYPIWNRTFSIPTSECISISECKTKNPYVVIEAHLTESFGRNTGTIEYQLTEDANGNQVFRFQFISLEGVVTNAEQAFPRLPGAAPNFLN